MAGSTISSITELSAAPGVTVHLGTPGFSITSLRSSIRAASSSAPWARSLLVLAAEPAQHVEGLFGRLDLHHGDGLLVDPLRLTRQERVVGDVQPAEAAGALQVDAGAVARSFVPAVAAAVGAAPVPRHEAVVRDVGLHAIRSTVFWGRRKELALPLPFPGLAVPFIRALQQGAAVSWSLPLCSENAPFFIVQKAARATIDDQRALTQRMGNTVLPLRVDGSCLSRQLAGTVCLSRPFLFQSG